MSVLLLALCLAVPQEHSRADTEDPLELFRESCLTCHAPPDPRFAVDRAWLQQVKDTA